MALRLRPLAVGLQIEHLDKLNGMFWLFQLRPRTNSLRSRGRLRSTMILERRRPRLRWTLRIFALWSRDSIRAAARKTPAMLPQVSGHLAEQSFLVRQ